MKKRRYFCDVVLSPSDAESNKFTVFSIIIISICAFIIGIISYNVILRTYSYEFDTYSIDEVKYAKEISDMVVKEGYGFDLSFLPKDDIDEYNLNFLLFNTIELTYSLKRNEDLHYAPSIKMCIVLNNDLKIIEKSVTSEEDYIGAIRSNMIIHSFLCVIIGIVTLYISFLIVMFLGCIISYCHKIFSYNK